MRRVSSSLSKLLLVVDRLRRRLARRRRALQASCAIVTLFAGAAPSFATSVKPPSFPELVAEADAIARATVTDITARWVDSPNGRVIKTFVTVSVEKRLKGTTPDTVTLEFLGGTVGGDTLHVSGMPEFKIGETEIVFIQGNGVQFCPLVRFGHGRYHVRRDAAGAQRFVTRDDDSPLESVDDVSLPADDAVHRHAARSAARALTPESFEAQIGDEVAHRRR
jgi:hypothetical protein